MPCPHSYALVPGWINPELSSERQEMLRTHDAGVLELGTGILGAKTLTCWVFDRSNPKYPEVGADLDLMVFSQTRGLFLVVDLVPDPSGDDEMFWLHTDNTITMCQTGDLVIQTSKPPSAPNK